MMTSQEYAKARVALKRRIRKAFALVTPCKQIRDGVSSVPFLLDALSDMVVGEGWTLEEIASVLAEAAIKED
jgi:hypothetical protein